jgi:nucleotide-binding universal stress UspA family protein
MFTQIMVPLDGSELAERALPCAERLARATGATLHLVRVAGPVFARDTDADQEADYADFLLAEMRDADAYLEQVRARLDAAGLTVRARRIAGTIAGALLDYAHEESIDLIVLTSHGRTGLARFPLGSVASRLVRHGTTPVLLVRAFGPPPDLTHAVVPLDGSPQAETALWAVAALRAPQPGASPIPEEMTVLRVVGSQEEGVEAERYLETLVPRLQAQGLCRDGAQRCQRRVVQGAPATAILAAAGAQELVVMATHGHSWPTRWAIGSVADRVTAGGAAAVLLVRAGTPALARSQTRPQHTGAADATPEGGAQDETAPHDDAAVRHVLVPLDGSALAARALPCAQRLATALSATLHLVRVVEPPPARLHFPINVYDTFLHAETTAARDYLAAASAQVSTAGTVVQTTYLLGDPASTLLEYAHAAGIDLIVMCSHGRSGVARFALGSVAEHLLHEGHRPLVQVRAFGPAVALERAVVPLDGSLQAEAALGMVARLAPAVVQAVTLLRVVDRPEEGPEAERYLAEVVQRLTPQGLVCQGQVLQGDPAQAILDVAGIDRFVVMATHGRSGLTRWALGSVADRVARGGAAAVVLVRDSGTHGQLATG